jgi:hypothetical protein
MNKPSLNKNWELASKPARKPRSVLSDHLSCLAHYCGGLLRPTRGSGAASRSLPLLGLAPGRGCLATRLAPDAGALLPRRFTLAGVAPLDPALRFSVALFQQVSGALRVSARPPLRVLPGTVPCGARTFLGGLRLWRARRDRSASLDATVTIA